MKLRSLFLGALLLTAPLSAGFAAETTALSGNAARSAVHPPPARGTMRAALAGQRALAPAGTAARAASSGKVPALRRVPPQTNVASLPAKTPLRAKISPRAPVHGAGAPLAHAGLPVAMARRINRPPLVSHASIPGVIGGPAAYDARKGAVLQGMAAPRRR